MKLLSVRLQTAPNVVQADAERRHYTLMTIIENVLKYFFKSAKSCNDYENPRETAKFLKKCSSKALKLR